MRNKLFLLPLAVIFALSGCGYDGHYRYPCQDPANYSNSECTMPLCKVDGTCTIDILGFDPTTGEEVTVETEQDGQE
jgi:predicted small lipoprotein YifL